MQMTCPKCHGEMRTYERSGVTIDQCGECRGIFLDRGELEKLFEAESNWNQQHSAPAGQRPPAPASGGYAPPPPPPPGGGYGAPPPPPPPAHGYPPAPAPAYGGGHYGYHGHYHRKKRHRGFLGELFD
ncbi:TFIIB-type zinc ribbon-containing protein [Phytohabitans kaempferiae]|uniref:Zf-TFIIB domain-containing protein n=1 Tax=Phytohabitans kaempferiae TaxID=1620943 RepID=A0ABV6MDX8_9ACTN